jgi:hypothetical protein
VITDYKINNNLIYKSIIVLKGYNKPGYLNNLACELQIYCSIKSSTSTKIKNIAILNSIAFYKNNPKK